MRMLLLMILVMVMMVIMDLIVMLMTKIYPLRLSLHLLYIAPLKIATHLLDHLHGLQYERTTTATMYIPETYLEVLVC